jgi:hypothetical protein
VSHDLATEDLRVTVRDDDDILAVTIPAGTLKKGKVRKFAGLKRVKFTQNGTGPAMLALETVPMDLARADRVDHMVEVEIRIGPTFVTAQSRLWTFTGMALRTK